MHPIKTLGSTTIHQIEFARLTNSWIRTNNDFSIKIAAKNKIKYVPITTKYIGKSQELQKKTEKNRQ